MGKRRGKEVIEFLAAATTITTLNTTYKIVSNYFFKTNVERKKDSV